MRRLRLASARPSRYIWPTWLIGIRSAIQIVRGHFENRAGDTFVLLAFAVRWLVERFSRRYQYARNLGLVLGRLAQAVVLVFGPLVVATVVAPSFHTSDLVQVLGIGGIAIAFAFRDILQNFLAGILFLLHEPFRLSDQIKVGRV